MAMAPLLLASTSHAAFVITAVTDGDLSGGNPKSIMLQAVAPVADLTAWGVGSANNGGGSDGQEFTLPAGSAAAGDVFVIVPNSVSQDFFTNNFAIPKIINSFINNKVAPHVKFTKSVNLY